MGNPYLFICQPVILSTRVDRPKCRYRSAWHNGYSVLVHLSTCLPGLTGNGVNIGVLGIMGISYMSNCPPVNLSTCLPGLTGPDVKILYQGIMGNPYLFICQLVILSTRVDRPKCRYRSAWHNGYSVLVHLSTCLPGLTGNGVNIGAQGIMGISFLSNCRPVNLSTRVDSSRCKHIISRHYRYSVLVYLSTCQPGLTGPEVNIGVQGIMGIPYLSTCRHINLSTFLPGLTGQDVNIGVQSIMGGSFFSTCQPVNLSTWVDRYKGLQAEEMVSSYEWLLSVFKMAYCSHFILVSICAI